MQTTHITTKICHFVVKSKQIEQRSCQIVEFIEIYVAILYNIYDLPQLQICLFANKTSDCY